MDTLEPFLSVLRRNIEAGGWVLSGLQKTTSYEYDGAWEGGTLRSAYGFFHLAGDGNGEGPSLEAFVDEAETSLDGTLSLVMKAPGPERVPGVADLMEVALSLVERTVPEGIPAPVSVTYSSSPGRTGPESVDATVRFRARVPGSAVQGGERTIRAVTCTILEAFEEVRRGWALESPMGAAPTDGASSGP
ncbi:MAG: hypothetical protein OEO23_08090 [Gemmatimonadota bacterium]|nr:hypothetical protein [Gemmatimonadota bacterium]